MPLTLYCTRCQSPYVLVQTEISPSCPQCQRETAWTTMPPMKPVALTVEDRRFLASVRISSD